MDKVRLLLQRGYFPVQLPPAFSTELFAKHYKTILAAWGPKPKAPRNRPERFSVARSSYNRRTTSIVNPASYLLLCVSVAKYWGRIQNHYSKSKFSFSRPSMGSGLRAIKLNKFSDIHDRKILASAGYRFALITDITQFFPTIYTHSIPWALHGKDVAKANRRKQEDAFFGNILDRDCTSTQDDQTLGLPVGPDTSHVIAEIIGVAIDRLLRQKLGSWPNGFRYVDDFYLFFNSRSEAEAALSEIRSAAAEFELQINAQKTRIVETRELIEESWKFRIKSLTISPARHAQLNDIHHFFEILFGLEKEFRDESVVKYGLKLISSRIIKKTNWIVFEAYLLHCAFAFPNSLQTMASILTTYNGHGYALNFLAISRTCNEVIRASCGADGHSEIAWALWILIELELELEKDCVARLNRVSSSACLLLASYLLRLKGSAHADLLNQSLHPEKLYGSGWLFAYEGARRNWLGAAFRPTDVDADIFFGILHRAGVSFFQETIRLTPIFSLKENLPLDLSIFDTDEELDNSFDFNEIDDEYFDQSNNDTDGDIDAEDDSGTPP